VLLSMTGHGEAHHQQQGLAIVAEVRSINNKYFKFTLRAPEAYLSLESQLESLVRESVRRGTVQLTLRVDRQASPDDFQLNAVVLNSYRQQLESLKSDSGKPEPVTWSALLALPGVVVDRTERSLALEAEWPLVQQTVRDALSRLAKMRADEGSNMAADLRGNLQFLVEQLGLVAERAPQVVENYRERLTERVNHWLQSYQIQLQAGDVIREVGLFTERSDISEEMVRLRSHLEQFETFLKQEESAGRKLDFLTQEMFRETNTIGSKANDAIISRVVIEMKAAIERIREMIQNVE